MGITIVWKIVPSMKNSKDYDCNEICASKQSSVTECDAWVQLSISWGFNQISIISANDVCCPLQVSDYRQHDDVIKWRHFPRYWPFVRGIHRSPVNSPHKGQWRGALMFSLICVWINVWVNNREAGDLRRHRVHYDVIVMVKTRPIFAQLIRNRHLSVPVVSLL